jgi:glycosyltransferase involved in cell wall biosynthesis
VINNLLISIITPVYNREDCIERCIKSVQNNSFKNFEHIIIDDGSKDGTYNLVQKLMEKNNNLILSKNTENKGVCFSFNRGIEKSNGDYIIFLGSDDKLTEDALQLIEDTIIKFPIYNHYLFLPDDMKIFFENVPKLQKEHAVVEFRDWLSGEIWGDFVHVIKKECLSDIKFDENFRIYEGITFMQIYKKNKVQFFTNQVISIRERNRDDSVTREYELRNLISIENQFNILTKQLSMFREDYLSNNLKTRYYNLFHRAVLLGLASRKYDLTENMLKEIDDKIYLKIIQKTRTGILIRNIIYLKSFINSMKRNIFKNV